MRKLDRIGVIVLAFTLFVAYWGWAGLLYFLGSISLPLGSLASYGLILVLVDIVIVNLYTFRQRRRARTNRNRVRKTR
jgi:membrane protease YdiL (CAAX protease family)